MSNIIISGAAKTSLGSTMRSGCLGLVAEHVSTLLVGSGSGFSRTNPTLLQSSFGHFHPYSNMSG